MADDAAPQIQQLFVDEAGDPTLFRKGGRIIVDTEGCSRFFIVGKLEVDDPQGLTASLGALRADLLADPYFAGVPSLQPEAKKTALYFHAKDDVPEVRYQVLRLLRGMERALRFHAVVKDKVALVRRVQRRTQEDPAHKYRPDEVYDDLIHELFRPLHGIADGYEVCIARRGNRDRTQALTVAIERAEQDFERAFGFKRATQPWRISVADPGQAVCLQAVDYFLWTLQRFYEVRRVSKDDGTVVEVREDRFLGMLWPQIGEIHDLDFGGQSGTFYRKNHPLTIADRFTQAPK